ncbi:multidrug effflux MFS transporter [Novispirillum sp. DQ9]|uniref:multidrug effflux MFS transporter n=1 Tax=Novispirillum sp. DQ9 TaxID=3398612 RepID=UPI003C7DFD7C
MTASPAPAAPPAAAPAFIAMLVGVAAVSPLGINLYLPSMPGMARSLGVDFAGVQLTLSLYLAAVAVGQLIVGPLSDRFGRRPVLLAGLALFVAGSVACLAAPSLGVLIAGRVVQAVGGCAGIALSRAVVRDLYGRDQAASMIGYVTMGMAVAPMIAPTIGGLLDGVAGWRGSFAFLAAFGAVVLVVAWRMLYETHTQRSTGGSARHLLRGYASLTRSRPFWGYALTIGFTAAMFFTFIAGASYVMIELMGRSPVEYGLYFACVPGGYLIGNFLTGRHAVRVGPDRMILIGTLIALLGALAMTAGLGAGLFHPAALFGPMFLVGLGNGFVLPNGIAGAVSVNPAVAGAAAGLSGSIQIGFGALAAPVVGAVLDGSAWPMIAMMGAFSVLAIASFGLVGLNRKEAGGER